jgi:hypothetical protein
MFAILRGANGRRHEVDFNNDPATVDVAMRETTVQITMTAADSGDLSRAAALPSRGHAMRCTIDHDEGQETMAKRPVPPTATEKEVRELLERYRCPVPFHEVRTRFLGNVATPVMSASPIKMVEGLWGGELPDFGSINAAKELIGALIMGLWNRLTRHQERSTPFRLTRPDVAATREGLATLALIRRQELDGFVEGLFGAEKAIDLPERAHRSLSVLGELRSLIAGVLDVATNGNKVANPGDIEDTLRHMQEMTRIAEHEMHAVVLSCKRARRDMLASLPARKPTLH